MMWYNQIIKYNAMSEVDTTHTYQYTYTHKTNLIIQLIYTYIMCH